MVLCVQNVRLNWKCHASYTLYGKRTRRSGFSSLVGVYNAERELAHITSAVITFLVGIIASIILCWGCFSFFFLFARSFVRFQFILLTIFWRIIFAASLFGCCRRCRRCCCWWYFSCRLRLILFKLCSIYVSAWFYISGACSNSPNMSVWNGNGIGIDETNVQRQEV